MDDEYYRYSDSFERAYRCYPFSHIEKSHLENGDKIIMPLSALHCLVSMQIDYPMLFEIHNPSTGQVSHCGVLEFSTEEGSVFLPNWMMENMQLGEGDLVEVKNVSLQKGTYMKLQPHTKDLIEVSNPKAVLETKLRNFSCLTTGDTIMITHCNKKFYIDIVETKPSSAISIIETDCEVDFTTPLDYKEPEKPATTITWKNASAKAQEEPAMEEPKFKPFTGVGRRLGGNPSTESATPILSPMLKEDPLFAAESADGTSRATRSNSSSYKYSGKLNFGSNVIEPPSQSTKLSKEGVKAETSKNEEQKFQPFTGKKYTLIG